MENTLNLLLQDTSTQWYTVSEDEVIGPLTNQDVLLQVQAGQLNYASFLWKEGTDKWTRIVDIPAFAPILPGEPGADMLEKIKAKVKASQPAASAGGPPPIPAQEQRRWYVYIDNAQYGPFGDQELRGLIGAKRVTAETFIWKKGFDDWKLAQEVSMWSDEFADAPAAKKPAAEESSDRRRMPRKPLEAKLLLTDGNEVGWALCRDISVGGMQVLMDNAVSEVGAQLKINVTAEGENENFACEAEIVRVLEDGRGFSVRFTSLPDRARRAIAEYIKE